MPFCILKHAVLHRRTARIARPNGPLGRAGHRLLCQNAWPERLLCISLHKTSCTRQSVSKLPLRSFALSLHKTSYTRQSVSKLTLHSFAVHFHFQRPSVPAAQVAPSRGLQPDAGGRQLGSIWPRQTVASDRKAYCGRQRRLPVALQRSARPIRTAPEARAGGSDNAEGAAF